MILDILKLAKDIAYPKKQGREAIELDEIDDELLTRIWLEVANKRNRQAKEEKLWTKKEWEAYSKAHPDTEIRPKFRKKDDSKKDDSKKDDSSPIDSFGVGGKSSVQHDPNDIEFDYNFDVKNMVFFDWFEKLGKTRKDQDMAIAHLAGLGGLPSGKEYSIDILNDGDTGMVVSINGEHIEDMGRQFYFNNDGSPKQITNEAFFLSEDAPDGIGLRVFASQVANARKAGFKKIATNSIGHGDGTMNNQKYSGYYTWARFGYRSPSVWFIQDNDQVQSFNLKDEIKVEILEKAEQAGKREEIQGKIDSGYLTTQDLMLIGAQDVWKKYGVGFGGDFDLDKASISSEILERYIHEKKGSEYVPKKYLTNSDGYLHGNEKTPAVNTPNGVKAYFDNGLLSRHSGPAITTKGGYREYWLNGEKLSPSDWESHPDRAEIDEWGTKFWFDKYGNRGRVGDKPAIVYSDGREEYYERDRLHRDGDKPAIIEPDGHKEYWQNGGRHRDGDQPAVIRSDGTKEYWLNGVKHREGDQPAVIRSDGTNQWFIRGKMGRVGDKPSMIKKDGSKYWYEDDVPHRLSGPAHIGAKGQRQWFLDGTRISESEYSSDPDVISWGNNKEWTREEWDEYKKLHPNTQIKPKFKSETLIGSIINLAKEIISNESERDAIELDEIDDELLTRIWSRIANRSRKSSEEYLWTRKEWDEYKKEHPGTMIRPKFRKEKIKQRKSETPISEFGINGKFVNKHKAENVSFKYIDGTVDTPHLSSEKVNSFFQKLGKTEFDRRMSIAHLAGLGGLPQGSDYNIEIVKRASAIECSIQDDKGMIRNCARIIDVEKNTIENVILKLKDDAPKGTGLSLFSSQVAFAREAGIGQIATYADGKGNGTLKIPSGRNCGFYVWARFGYQGKVKPLMDFKEQFQDEVLEKAEQAGKRQEIQAKIDSGNLTAHDLMKIGAHDAWRKYGNGFEGIFDLDDGSSSIQVLSEYIREKEFSDKIPKYQPVKRTFTRPVDMPTEVTQSGIKIWRNDAGQKHREGDKPAVIDADGGKYYYRHGELHRDDNKPAYIDADGGFEYYHNNQLNRLDGPAVVNPFDDEFNEYWLYGQELTQQEYYSHPDVIKYIQKMSQKEWTREEWDEYKKLHPATKIKPKFK